MSLITNLPLLDQLLDEHHDAIGKDFTAYRNHCHRMVNFCYLLASPDHEAQAKIQIAAAFHDLAIWTHGTLDYLRPSAGLARAHLSETGQQAWADEVDRMIDLHHQFRACPAPDDTLVEAFRKADLVDVSLGLVRFGLSAATVREVRAALPNAGFHKRLVQLTLKQLGTNPLKPLPMMKW